MRVLDYEGMASFASVREACRIATEAKEPVILRNWHRDFVVQPEQNPHELYPNAFPEYTPSTMTTTGSMTRAESSSA
jgi:hypothetical protein